jgi:hypothetical protein
VQTVFTIAARANAERPNNYAFRLLSVWLQGVTFSTFGALSFDVMQVTSRFGALSFDVMQDTSR